MKDRSSDYEASNGWSSKLFAVEATKLMKELRAQRVEVVVGRTVIHIKGTKTLKAYVHHNGRSKEYATITNEKGEELATFHYTAFNDLRSFVLGQLQ